MKLKKIIKMFVMLVYNYYLDRKNGRIINIKVCEELDNTYYVSVNICFEII